MNPKAFEKLFKDIVKRNNKTALAKNKEYASDSDKMHNFKRAAAMLQETPEKALIGMWVKHIISLLDMVDKIESGNYESITKKLLEEKIGDAMIYLALLEGIIKERYGWT
jgi:hypothetical protein